jgi:hypothetical protein
MNGSRLALVADDQRLAATIQAHLKKALGHGAFQCDLGSIRNHITRDTDGLVLLATNSATEAEKVLRLVQEICLQRLPLVLLVAEGEDFAGNALAPLA